MDVCSATNEIMRAFDAKKHDKICEAIVRKDYALAFRNACVRKLYPLIMALMKHNDLLAFDLNAPSSNGNTALDWLDHHVPNPISDEHQATRATLCALLGISEPCKQDAIDIEETTPSLNI